jgi:hypothetical protein
MARMGDWRQNKDEEIQLDGIGGVNIIVKADVHRSGLSHQLRRLALLHRTNPAYQASTSHATHSKTKPRLKVLLRWLSVLDMK